MNKSQEVQEEVSYNSNGQSKVKEGGSVLGVLEEVIRVGQAMGYSMEGCEKDVESIIGNQGDDVETKMENVSHMDVKFMWGNSNYDFVYSDSLGSSGGILCIWEETFFRKEHVTISDYFVAIYGSWIPNKTKILLVAIYAPQDPKYRRFLWDYISILLSRWNGEVILMGDFNEVRSSDERRGSCFNSFNARIFDNFISSSSLVDVKMEGYSFTWSHPSANKMSKLDRFLVSDGVISLFPSITAFCLDRHLSDHRPILLCEVRLDFGPVPFRMYHSWFRFVGFDDMVVQTWGSLSFSDRNGMIRFKKKLQELKKTMRVWIKDKNTQLVSTKRSISDEMRDIDKLLDAGRVSDSLLFRRNDLKCQLHDIKSMEAMDSMQKSKVKWAVEGDENTNFFHGIINKKRSQLAVRGVFDDGVWLTDPVLVKKAFHDHYESRFKKPTSARFKINFPFPNRLTQDQVAELERGVSRDEIRLAVWDCGENKSPGPDGFTFEFFRKYWNCIGPDFCVAVEHFFVNGSFSKGCNSSFVALIPKVTDAKFVNDYRPISLIGSVYKVVTKIMATRLAMVIESIVSDTQSAFVAKRQILDGPFILNEVLHWCKRKNKKAMFFKVDFAKAYDSVRWDFLIDVLEAFGFGTTWCNWVRGTFCFAKGSILVNGSPSNEFQFHCGLKQGDPLSPYLFILVMESLHLSVCRAVNDRLFNGIRLHGSLSLSHLFYADDALFIGEWSDANLRGIIQILKCFHLASGLHINLNKSQLLGVGVPRATVEAMAISIGCSIMQNKFRYLGVMVGDCMSRFKAWEDVVIKLRTRLSKWKAKTLSIGGRLTLLKSVLGASPLYTMSIFKVPKGVLKEMESIRNNFFKGAELSEKKITWVAWDKVLASKKKGGLGVSSYYALNRALLLKWVWRFVSQDDSLWFRVIQAIHGSRIDSQSIHSSSLWSSILKEVHVLKDRGFDFLEKCSKRVDRGGVEKDQLTGLAAILDTMSLSPSLDRWVCSLSSDGDFCVKDARTNIDDMFLPSHNDSTRWVKGVPIKINIFAWRARRDCLPTRLNLIRRGVTLETASCPICLAGEEDVSHVFFRCPLAQAVLRRICRWWEVVWQQWSSFSEWLDWFSDIRLTSKVKSLLEGVFMVAWWAIWGFRNRSIFETSPPNRSVIFDDIVSHSFLWCYNRCNRSFTWDSWLKNPHLISL
ncbi:RNA-directed DNA polymerase, eukaryota [Tanacetum coccineum]